MIVFLIGPSAGYFQGNRKAFSEAAGTLRSKGLTVVNPRELEDRVDDPRAVYRALLDCDTVVTMKGYEADPQASLSASLANAVGMEVLGLERMLGKTRP